MGMMILDRDMPIIDFGADGGGETGAGQAPQRQMRQGVSKKFWFITGQGRAMCRNVVQTK